MVCLYCDFDGKIDFLKTICLKENNLQELTNSWDNLYNNYGGIKIVSREKFGLSPEIYRENSCIARMNPSEKETFVMLVSPVSCIELFISRRLNVSFISAQALDEQKLLRYHIFDIRAPYDTQYNRRHHFDMAFDTQGLKLRYEGAYCKTRRVYLLQLFVLKTLTRVNIMAAMTLPFDTATWLHLLGSSCWFAILGGFITNRKFLSSFFFTWMILLNSYNEGFSTSLRKKVVLAMISWMMMATILSNSYSGCFVSFFCVKRLPPLPSSLEEMLEDKMFQEVTLKS
jgi:hypothetical protein